MQTNQKEEMAKVMEWNRQLNIMKGEERMTAPKHRPPKPRRIREEMNKDFFSIYETAELLGLHHNTIRRMIKSGELPAHQFGRTWRINRADLEELTKPNNISK